MILFAAHFYDAIIGTVLNERVGVQDISEAMNIILEDTNERKKLQNAGGRRFTERNIAACRNSSGGSHKRLAVLDDQAFESRVDLLTTRAVPWRFHLSTK